MGEIHRHDASITKFKFLIKNAVPIVDLSTVDIRHDRTVRHSSNIELKYGSRND